jgi:hypothetical protein
MSKVRPNIITPFNDKARFKSLVQEVINDTFIFTITPDSVTINDGLVQLTLSDKKFVYQDMPVDTLSDYIDVYLTGLKVQDDIYVVVDNGNDLIINFTQIVGLNPELFTINDFEVKGKIVSR